MRRLSQISVLAGFFVILLLGCGEAEPPVATDAFVIENVTVIDVETGDRTADQTVVVNGNRITAVGMDDVPVPAGARVVDGQGQFLIPGVWDMHVHALRAAERALPLAVATGLTGVRDMGSTLAQVPETREAIANGLVSPRLIIAGEGLEGVPGGFPGLPPNTVLPTPEEGREMVRKLAALEVDFLKAHTRLNRDTFYAILDEAEGFGIPVDGHLQPGLDITEASDAGQRTIEHLNGLQMACAADPATLDSEEPDAAPIELDLSRCEETIRHLVENGTWLTPTLGGPGRTGGAGGGDLRTRQFNLTITRLAAEGGLRLLAGTDWPGPGYSVGNYSGVDNRSLMDELAGLVEAGLTPQQALLTATVNPAILLEMEDVLGSVETGKFADLLLLEADPLVDIANMKLIAAVVVNGWFIDAAEQQRMLDAEMAAREQENNEQ